VTWAGAYDAAVEAGATEAEAVRRADGAVRQTQGSFAPEDVSNIESRTPFIRLFTMYYGYFNMQANLLGTEFANAMHAGGLMRGAGRALYVFTLGFMLPAVLGEAILTAVRGEDWRDDDEWWLDDLMWFFFGAQYRTAAAMLPGGAVARSVFSVYERLAGGPAGAYEERITLSPAIRTIEETVRAPASVYKAIAGEGSAKRAVRDGLSAVGVVTGHSAVTGAIARPAGYVADVLEGETEPESALDVARGLASGQSRR